MEKERVLLPSQGEVRVRGGLGEVATGPGKDALGTGAMATAATHRRWVSSESLSFRAW